MHNKKNILFIHHGVGIGGAFISLLNIVEAIDKEKYDISVLFVKYEEGVNIFAKRGINSYYVKSDFYHRLYKYYQHFSTNFSKWYQPHIYLRELLSWFLNAKYYAKKELSSFDYDILYLNSSVLSDWAYAAKKNNKKVVLHLRETFTKGYFGIRRGLLKKLIEKNADIVISISKYNAVSLGLKKNFKVVYNYADKRYFEKKPTFNHIQPTKILYVGGYSYIKGFITMVKSLQFLSSDIKVLFAGHYPKTNITNNYKRKIKYLFFPYNSMKKSLQNLRRNKTNSQLIGLQKEIIKLYQEVDILISPFSKPHFSRPIIEAFALGKIVISSNVSGISEIIKDGHNGFIFELDDPKHLSEVILKVISLSPKKRMKIIETARIDAEERFSFKNIIKIEAIINQVFNK